MKYVIKFRCGFLVGVYSLSFVILSIKIGYNMLLSFISFAGHFYRSMSHCAIHRNNCSTHLSIAINLAANCSLLCGTCPVLIIGAHCQLSICKMNCKRVRHRRKNRPRWEHVRSIDASAMHWIIVLRCEAIKCLCSCCLQCPPLGFCL